MTDPTYTMPMVKPGYIWVLDSAPKPTWPRKRRYSPTEAVRMTAQMHRGAWKGRVDLDELASLCRVVAGRASLKDFRVLDEFGVTPGGRE